MILVILVCGLVVPPRSRFWFRHPEFRIIAIMPERPLHAPWRMDYIRALEKPEGDKCFLCAASAAQTAEQMRQSLVLWNTPQSIVLMNRYPYTNGHLMVAPRQHSADLELLDEEVRSDLMRQTVRAIELLKRAISPQGFNIGINLGRCAGAGVPGHVHQHIVPRWGGDVNFMSVVGEVRIIPEALNQLYDELLAVLKQM